MAMKLTPIDLNNLTASQLEAIMDDSTAQQSKLAYMMTLLELDHVMGITWLRLLKDQQWQMVTSLSRQNVLEYIKTDIHRLDTFVEPNHNVSFSIIDYQQLPNQAHLPKFLDERICVIVTKYYLSHTDNISFGINRDHFMSLSEADKMKLHFRLQHIISLLYATIQFTHTLELIDKVRESTHETQPTPSILDKLNFSSTQLDYLKYIAMGMTSKEIAIHLNKSYRTVQDTIKLLCEKTHSASKNELTIIANIITSHC